MMTSTPVLLVGVATAVYLANRWLQPKPLPGIPHLPVRSIAGDIPVIIKDTKKYGSPFEDGAFFRRTATELGPVFQVLMGPFTKWVIVNDVQEYVDIMAHRTKSLELSDLIANSFRGLMPNAVIALPTGDIWRRHRRVIANVMTKTYLSDMAPVMADNIQALVQCWKTKADITKKAGASAFRCQLDLYLSTLDTVSSMVVGKSFGALPNHVEQVVNGKPKIDRSGGVTWDTKTIALHDSLRHITQAGAQDAMILPTWIKPVVHYVLTNTPTYKRHRSNVEHYILGAIKDRRAQIQESRAIGEEPSPSTSIVALALEQQESGLDLFTEEEIKDEAVGMLFAGHDTTSATLQWCIKAFTDYPETQQRLRRELLSTLNDCPESRPLTYDDVNSGRTPYLEAFVTEALRCGRLTEMAAKTTKEPMTILGHTIPSGTLLFFTDIIGCESMTPTTYNEAKEVLASVRTETSLRTGLGERGLWKEADVKYFNPERWLKIDENGILAFDPKAGFSFPFGLGWRSCAGRNLAMLQLKMYVAMLNLAFFFDKVPEPLNSDRATYDLIRTPDMVFINPKCWDGI